MVIFLFILGLFIGSFLNCVAYRLNKEESFVRGRSYCPHCKKTICWYDLLPVISYAFLRGRCRNCKKLISIQYPLAELATGLAFALVAMNYSNIYELIYLLVVSCFLILIFIYDLKHYLIPDKFLIPAIGVVVVYSLIFGRGLLTPLLAGLLPAGFFLLLFVVSMGKWIGLGDVKLAVFMGLVLSWPNILVALFLACFAGGIIGLILIVFQRKELKSEIPFGPFLTMGTFVALLWGDILIKWYLKTLI